MLNVCIVRRPEAPTHLKFSLFEISAACLSFRTKTEGKRAKTKSDSETGKDPILSLNARYRKTLIGWTETERDRRNKDSDMKKCGMSNMPEAESSFCVEETIGSMMNPSEQEKANGTGINA